jgi:serine/threonine protein kinase
MSGVYDNWERLVGATLRREQLRRTAQRSFSDLSLASSSSFNSRASSRRLFSFNLPNLAVGEKIDYEMILRSTNHLSRFNHIWQGHTGDLFYGVLDDGTQVVVKKIDLSSAEKELHYISEVEAFGKVSHSRLVPLLGHCSGNMDEKFLVYKYMPNGDLASVVRSKIFHGLDWPTRLKIATGAAEALCYLHHQCTPPLVHRYPKTWISSLLFPFVNVDYCTSVFTGDTSFLSSKRCSS